MRKRLPILFIIPAIFLLGSLESLSQDKNRVGISGGVDKAFQADARGLAGFSFERIVNKHNSAEIGFYYRSTVNDKLVILVPVGSNFAISEQFFVLEKFITIPLVYNYKSGIVNISMGVSADIFSGWKQLKHVSYPPSAVLVDLQDYKFDHKLLWGGIAKVSKTFRVSQHIFLEPSIYYNPIFTRYSLYSEYVSETRQYYGALLSAKFAF